MNEIWCIKEEWFYALMVLSFLVGIASLKFGQRMREAYDGKFGEN